MLLAIAWAGFLIPKALRHHDEAARTRSIDRFSASTRVLAHSEPVDEPGTGRETRLVTPAVTAPPSRPDARADVRTAARAAARRRRRILGLLLLGAAGTAGAAALAYLPWWSVAVPVGLSLVFLVLCRTQVRREVASVVRPAAAPDTAAAPVLPVAPSVPAQRTAEEPEPAWADEAAAAPVVSDLRAEDTVDVPVSALQGVAGADGGSIWDPLPVTLPTYVTAPKAHRTVRTIELGEPGTWTSGHTTQDAEIAVQAAQPVAQDEPGQRAVGS